MKTTKTTMLISLFALCQALPATSADASETTAQTFYFSANVGGAWMQDVSFTGDEGSGKLRFYPGPKVDVAGGYNFTESLAVELEVGVLYLFGSSQRFNGFEEVYDDLFQAPFMADLRCQIPTRSRWHPFVGVGIGAVYTEVYDVEGWTDNSIGHDFTFGYQTFAGVRYQISPVLEVGLEYDFMGTLDHSLNQLQLGETLAQSIAFSICLRF